MERERLVEVEEEEVVIDFEVGEKCRAMLHIRNTMDALPVAFKVQTTSPASFWVKPPNGFIPPLARLSLEIVLKPQTDIPAEFPFSREKFLLKTATAPEMAAAASCAGQQRVPPGWFAHRKSQVLLDASLRVFYAGDLLLSLCLQRNELVAARHMLARLACQNKPDENGRTVVHVAAASGHVDILESVLDSGGCLDTRSHAGRTALHEAVYLAHVDSVRTLLAHGTDVHAGAPPFDSTSLHVAAMLGSVEMSRLLISGGAHIESRDAEGRTPLHRAVGSGHVVCARVLLEAGADKDARCNDGRTALFRAVWKGFTEIVDLLLDWGANPRIPNNCGQTPLHVASKRGHVAVTVALEATNQLLSAARAGNVEVVKLTLRKEGGARTINRSDQSGWTALHCASFKGHIETVTTLLDFGANVQCQDKDGHTALHCAVEGGHKSLVQLLVKKGANIMAQSNRGVTPIQVASTLGYTSIYKSLENSIQATQVFAKGLSSSLSDSPLPTQCENKSKKASLGSLGEKGTPVLSMPKNLRLPSEISPQLEASRFRSGSEAYLTMCHSPFLRNPANNVQISL